MKRKLFKFALLCASVFMLPMGAWADDVTWNFTNWSDATITNLNADATNWGYTAAKLPITGGYWDYKVATAATATGETLSANSVAISELSGLKFYWPAASEGGRIRIDNRSTNKALFFKSHNEKVIISGLTAGKKVSINMRGNSSTRMKSGNSNVVAYKQAPADDANRTDVFIVNSSFTSGDVAFSGEANGASFNMFSITITDATDEELAIANFGTDDYVTATTLWTFDQYFASEAITTLNTVLNYSGLYMKDHSSGTNTNNAGASARTSSYGTYTVRTSNYCNVAGGHVFNANEIKSRKASTGITDCMAINIGTSGRLYIEGSLGAASRRIEVYEGNGLANLNGETISNLKKGTLTATGANKDEAVLEVTITEPGTYWISGNYTDGSTEKTCGHRIYSIMFIPTTATAMTKTVTLTSAGGGYTTFSAPQSYIVPEGVTAYYASDVDETKATMTSITAGNVIPACTGVILYKSGVTEDTEITLTSSESYSPVTNMMLPNLADYALQNNNGGKYNYTLAAGPVFKHSSGVGTLAAGKAFLRTTVNVVESGNNARGIRLSFGGGITGVSDVKVQKEEVTNGEYYDLMGRRVANPTKGLYIVNGKKVFIK